MKRHILVTLFAIMSIIPVCNAKDYMQDCVNRNKEEINKALESVFNENTLNDIENRLDINHVMETTAGEKANIALAVAKTVLGKCATQIPDFLEYEINPNKTVTISLKRELSSGEDVEIEIPITVVDVLNSLKSPVAIVVWPNEGINDKTLVKSDDANLTKFWYADNCSEHNTTFVSNNNQFNQAALSVFKEDFPNADIIQIDQPNGTHTLAFPGSIMIHLKNSADTQMVYYTDVIKAYTRAKKLQTALEGTACSPLNIYVVALKSAKINEQIQLKVRTNESYNSGNFGDGVTITGGSITGGLLVAAGITAIVASGAVIPLLLIGAGVAGATGGWQFLHDYDINEDINEVFPLSYPMRI